MASATRHRFPNFGTAPGNADGEQSRSSHASTLGQSFATGGTSWKGGIWGNSAIGSGLKGGLNDTGRAQENASALANNSEAITGSGSLLSSSESDNWGLRQTTPWNAIDSTSPILSSSNKSHASTSPVRHRNSNQHPPPQKYGENPRSSSPYFSMNQQAVNGNGMVNTASQKGFLDPTSGSFVTSRTFDPGNLSGFSLSGDEENRQQAMSMVFGNSDTSTLPPGGRQMFQQGMRSGHNSAVASRGGSIPPSRSGDEQHSYFGADVLTNPQSSRFGQGSTSFPSRPSHSTQTSTYSSHAGNRRYGGEQSSNNYNVDFITGELRKMNPGKENEYPLYPSYQSPQEQSSLPYEYSQQLDGSAHAWSADEVVYQNGLGSFTPNRVPSGSQNLQHNHNHNPPRNIQFGEHSPQSPNGNDTRRSHHSPFYSTGGTPPSGDQYRAPSRGVANPRVPNGQAAILERKLRGLQQEQQSYIQPQPNPLQFRAPFAHPYDYNSQNAMRMNPLAQYYPMPPVPNFLPPIIPRGPSRDHDVGQNLRSALLEEFRSNSKTNKRYELKDIYNHIVEFSGDQHGSRFIQQKLETANSDEKDQVFREIQPNSIQLMTDVFGNYVIQKFFEHGNQSQKKILANQMKNHILTLSLQMYGCRVVQKALEHILTDQQASLVKELEQHVLRCVKDQNGNHVVQKAIERVPAEHIQFIINAFTGQVQSLATHPYGCRVIQRMLEHCAEPARTSVLQELHACASSLIVDQYGNYVTQHVIEHGRDGDRAKIISLVTSQLLTFSKHKFASNVVEKSIQFGSDEQRHMIVATLTALNEKNESPLQSLMRDQYGNYVIQKLLAQLAGSEYDDFVDNIKPQLALLKRFSYGKQIAAIEKVIYSNPTTVQHNHNVSPPTSVAPTPPPLTSDAQSPQSSSLPSTNNSTVDGPVGDRKARAEAAVEVDVATTT